MNGRARERTLRPGLDAFLSTGHLFGGALIDRHALRSLQQSVGLALLAALAILAAALAERRFAGALVRPLSPWLLITAGVALSACAASIRLLLFWRPLNGPYASLRTLLVFVPTLLLILIGISLSLHGSGTWSLGCFWLVLIGAETWSLRPWRPNTLIPGKTPEPPRSERPLANAAALLDRLQAKGLDLKRADADHEDDAAETLPSDDVTQQMVRRRQADGTQVLSGTLRITFAGGERTATAHLAFCPPFARAPEFSAAAMAGPGAQVRLVQVLAYGVRLEIKLDAVNRAAESVLIGFEATERGTPSAERGTEPGELGP